MGVKAQAARTEVRDLGQVVAPGAVSFALHTLGWRAFQDLAGAILREVMGQSVQTFADGNDAGRDGAFYGRWERARGGTYGEICLEGPFVLQCKHSSSPDATLTPSLVKEEIAKARRLVEKNLCRSYVLFSNARLSGRGEQRLVDLLRAVGVANPAVLGGSWISQTIACNQRLRMLVPRVYGLGDLSQVIDERAYRQAESLLNYLRPRLATFVPTRAYRRAADALQQHGFVLILGEPGAGKSVIAEILAMSAVDSWHCALIRAHSAEELLQHWNVNEPDQFFWVDDAFGPVRHEWTLSQAWALRMPSIMTAVKNGAKVVLTSRDYIYRDARRWLKEYAYPLLRESQVVVDIAELDPEERRRILYNHIRMGDQDRAFKTRLKPHLEAASEATPFRPEAARRLGYQEFTRSLTVTRTSVLHFMEHPVEYLRKVFDELDPDQQAALTLVYVAVRLPATFSVWDGWLPLIQRMGSTPSGVATALKALEGTFLTFDSGPSAADGAGWSFHHPTLREGFAAFMAAEPHLTDLFVAGLSDEALLGQIDCGGPSADGKLFVIAPELYGQVAHRLAAIRAGAKLANWSMRWAWHQFLAQRCSADFIRIYAREDSTFTSRLLDFGSYLGTVPEPKVLARLNDLGLLPETDRKAAVAIAADLAVETPDADWLDANEWKVLANAAERRAILARVRSELVPRLDDELRNARANYPAGEDPYAYYQPLEETLERYASAFSEDPETQDQLTAAADEVRRYRDNVEDYDPRPASRWSVPRTLEPDPHSARSIFDDVDE